MQRCLQEKATNISWWQSGQRMRRGTRYSGSALLQVAALQKCLHRACDDRVPEAILGRKPLVIDLLEGLEMLLQQPPQVGGLRIAGAVQRQRLNTRGGHDRQGTGPVLVYATPLDQMYTSCQAGRPSPAGNGPLAGTARSQDGHITILSFLRCPRMLLQAMTHILAIVALLLAPLTTSQAAEAPKPLDKPNVVLFLVDDLGYGDVACHGNLHVKTPQIDAFACQAAELTQFHVSPVCSPTRASLMTGRYNFRTGVADVYGSRHERWHPPYARRRCISPARGATCRRTDALALLDRPQATMASAQYRNGWTTVFGLPCSFLRHIEPER